MRVLVVNRYWKPFGGVEQCVRDLEGVLEQRGHSVVPFAVADAANWPTAYDEYFPSPVEFHRGQTGERVRGVWRATMARDTRRALSRLLDDVEIDVAHVFNPYHHLGTPALLELSRRGIPVVWSLHDYKLGCPNVVCFSDRTRRACTVCIDHASAYAWAPPVIRCRSSSVGAGVVLSAEAIVTHLRRVYRRVPTVVTVLNALQRRAAARAGIDPARIHLVPNPVELGPLGETVRGSHALFVGRLAPLKGVDVLVRACAAAGLALRIVGDGPTRRELEALATSAGCDASFVGPVGREEVAGEMRAAGVLAVPSLWPDVAPLVVTEAWSAGLPVVGSAVGGLGELLAAERGVPVPPDDERALAAALRAVLDDPADGRRMVDRARSWALEELSRDRFVERMATVYAAAGVRL